MQALIGHEASQTLKAAKTLAIAAVMRAAQAKSSSASEAKTSKAELDKQRGVSFRLKT